MMKNKSKILLIVMLLTFVMSQILSIIYLKIFVLSLFPLMFYFHMLEKSRYKKELSKTTIDFRIDGYQKGSHLENIITVALILIFVLGFFLIYKFGNRRFNDFDFLLLLLINGWLIYQGISDSDLYYSYKFNKDCIIAPGLEMNHIDWSEIQELKISEKRYKFEIILTDNKVIKFRIDKSVDKSIDEIYNYLNDKIKNAVQQLA